MDECARSQSFSPVHPRLPTLSELLNLAGRLRALVLASSGVTASLSHQGLILFASLNFASSIVRSHSLYLSRVLHLTGARLESDASRLTLCRLARSPPNARVRNESSLLRISHSGLPSTVESCEAEIKPAERLCQLKKIFVSLFPCIGGATGHLLRVLRLIASGVQPCVNIFQRPLRGHSAK